MKKMWFLLQKNLKAIVESEIFDKSTKALADDLLKKIVNRWFILFLHFLLDILDNIQVKSKLLQEKGGTIAGKNFIIQKLIDSIESMKLSDPSIMKAYLSSVVCQTEIECDENSYNTFDIITWQDVELSKSNTFKPLYEIRTNIIEGIVEELNRYFPDFELEAFDIFDPYYIPNDIYSLKNYGIESIKIIYNLFDFDCTQESLIENWNILLMSMFEKYHDTWCNVKGLKTHEFWFNFLIIEEIWTDCTKFLIRTILSIPGKDSICLTFCLFIFLLFSWVK